MSYRHKYYTFPEVVGMIDQSYDTVRYAVLKQVVKPLQFGRTRLFTPDQVDVLKTYFQTRRPYYESYHTPK